MNTRRTQQTANGMLQHEGTTYRFGPFLLETPRRLLLRGSAGKTLPEKLFRILVLLLEAGGATVSKEAFFARVWDDEAVSDANLAQHICMLRQALGERAGENAFILTVAGEGYRLAIPVEAKLGLTMKGSCERCGAVLASDGDAFICSFECTYCQECARANASRCRNCGGELVARPRRPIRNL